MTFTQTGNTLVSDDARFCIERWRDHRGLTYVAWSTSSDWDLAWSHIANCDSAEKAKRAIDLCHKYGGTE